MSPKIQYGIAWLAIYFAISMIIFGMLSGHSPFLVSLGIAMIFSGLITYLVFSDIVNPLINFHQSEASQTESLETEELFSGTLRDDLPDGITIRYKDSTTIPSVTHTKGNTTIVFGDSKVSISKSRDISVSIADPELGLRVYDSVTGNLNSIGF